MRHSGSQVELGMHDRLDMYFSGRFSTSWSINAHILRLVFRQLGRLGGLVSSLECRAEVVQRTGDRCRDMDLEVRNAKDYGHYGLWRY